jgi:Sulfatase
MLRRCGLALCSLLLAVSVQADTDLVGSLRAAIAAKGRPALKIAPIESWAQVRPALQLPIPSDIEAPVEIPANGRLRTAIALRDRWLNLDMTQHAEPSRLQVTFVPTDGSAPTTLLDRTLSLRDRPAERGWLPVDLDLTRFAGQRGALRFQAAVADAPAKPGSTFALFSRPVLYDPVAQRARPNVLLITIDALRADHLRSYGYERSTSPNLDRLAAEGVQFTKAFANAPMTVPSLPQLLTGTYFPGEQDATLMSSLFAGGVPATRAIVRNPYLQVFLTLGARDAFDRTTLLNWWPAERISAKALEWIDRHAHERWGLYLHYLDTHTPYEIPPAEACAFCDPAYHGQILGTLFGDVEGAQKGQYGNARDQQRIVDLYDGAIRYTDQAVGHLLDGLRARGLLDHTMVVVTSDHGEELFDHGSFFHGQSLYDEQLHVPLIVRLPGGTAAGTRVETQVRHVDIVPSIADYASLPTFPTVQGASWRPLIEGRAEAAARPVFARAANPTFPWRFALRTPTHKLIDTVDPVGEQLFDLRIDAGERINQLWNPIEWGARDELRAALGAFRAPRAVAGFQLRAAAGPGPAIALEVDIKSGPALVLANPDRIDPRSGGTLAMRDDQRALSWKTSIGPGATQGIRFDRESMFSMEADADLTVDVRVDGRRLDPAQLRVGPAATPSPTMPFVFHLGASQLFGPRPEEPPLVAATPPSITTPPGAGVQLWLWRGETSGSGGVARPAVDPAQRERLKALGYVD